MSTTQPGSLSESAIKDLRVMLAERKSVLQAQLSERLAESEQDRDAVRAREIRDTDDVSFLAALAEVRLAGAARDIQELRDIEAALARIQGSVYGICSDCGDGIPEARLRAYPTAKRCRDCQEIKEKRQAAGFS